MPDALLYLAAGYLAGAIHVWWSRRGDCDRARLEGFRDGQRVTGQRKERDNG